ncbi:MAG: phosphatase PAP2 family protein [Ignavibacteriaceae bacterium]|nr:phosphatase PAP2 family protein [Ignavibacteriaceae bacterium]
MADFLYSLDLSVFYFFNHTLSTGFFDRFFSFITNVNNWYISYIILLGILFTKDGRRGKFAGLLVIFLILASDQFGAKVLKEWFARIRPCNVLPDAITPLGTQGTYSFPSNHALNNFAVAAFFSLIYPKLKYLLYTVASLIALSRVYLGLHYPSDILGGAVIGIVMGYLFVLLHRYLMGRWGEKKEAAQ